MLNLTLPGGRNFQGVGLGAWGWSCLPHFPPIRTPPCDLDKPICSSREAQGQGRSQSGLGVREAQKVGSRWEFPGILSF